MAKEKAELGEVSGKNHKSLVGDVEPRSKAGDGLALDAKQGIKQVHSAGSESSGDGHKKGESGLSRVMESEKNDDEFSKGTVGAPKELDGIQAGKNQDGMGDETLLYGGGYFEREKAGLEDGISLRETVEPDATEPNYNYDVDPLTGSAPERKIGRLNNYTVGGKRGNTFLIGEM